MTERSDDEVSSARPDSLENVQARLEGFRHERDWEQFHTLKNLAAAISVEAGELQEILLWASQEDESEIVKARRAEISAELADVFIQCLNFAAVAGIDVLGAIEAKIAENGAKYPVRLARGSAKKYTDLR